MIVKELETQTHADPLRRAGYVAERQMAHYLGRAFAETPDIKVLHHLRVERRGEVAQIDHLVLHQHGLIVIESKSVTGQISVNERGDWARHWKGGVRGVPSPVLQGKRQGELLHSLLDDHDEQLLGRMLGTLQKRFGSLHVDVLVAISDGGLIRGGKHVPAEVLKADQVPGRALDLIGRYRKANRLFSLNFKDAGYQVSEAELSGIAAFLKSRHQPHGAPDLAVREVAEMKPGRRDLTGVVFPPQQPQPPSRAAPPPACRHCQSAKLSVQYGKYGYYLKCAACGGNTPVKPVCAACGQPARLSKRGPEFTAACSGGHEWPYWTNL